MSKKIVILIRQRSGDIQASVKDRKGVWGKGRSTAASAVDLVQSNPELFKIEVEMETAENTETA